MLNNNKKLMIIILVIVVAVVAIFGVMLSKNDSRDNNKENEIIVDSSVIEQVNNDEGTLIKTDYCNLYFPKEWKGDYEVDYIESEGLYIAEFHSNIGGKTIHIFDIIFGDYNEEDVVKIGTYNDNGKKVNVVGRFVPINLGDEMSEKDANKIYEMQESLNYVAAKLLEEEGFIEYTE